MSCSRQCCSNFWRKQLHERLFQHWQNRNIYKPASSHSELPEEVLDECPPPLPCFIRVCTSGFLCHSLSANMNILLYTGSPTPDLCSIQPVFKQNSKHLEGQEAPLQFNLVPLLSFLSQSGWHKLAVAPATSADVPLQALQLPSALAVTAAGLSHDLWASAHRTFSKQGQDSHVLSYYIDITFLHCVSESHSLFHRIRE